MAGRIARPFVDQLLARTDIVDVVGNVVPLRKAGRDFQGLCPFHNEKTPSFTVSPEKQFYHCFGCGQHGSAIGFLMNHSGLSFTEAVQDLAARVGLVVEFEGGTEAPREDHSPLYSIMADAEKLYIQLLRTHPSRERAVAYLKGRGLTGEIAKRFGIGYAPAGWDTLLTALGTSPERQRLSSVAGLTVEREGGGFYDRFRDRIMFPIRDRRGRCIAFGGRVLDQGEPKYLNSPETPIFHKRRELYGLDVALKASAKLSRMLIVEGYMDVIALAQHGIGYSVATLGTATTAEHLEQLFRGAPEIVFCFDGDAAGQRASWRALEAALPLMHDGRTASFLFLPQGQDPDTLVRQEGKQAFETTDRFVGLSELLFKALEAQTDRRTLEGRARLVALAKPLIHKVPAGTFRQLLLERLVLLAQTTVDLPAGPRAPLPQAAARRSPLTNPRQRVLPVLSRALGLLLHQPALASLAEDFPALDVTSDPRLALLIDLLEFLREHPTITSGALVERFRDTPQMPLIDEILAPPVLASELWAAEFTGALQQILKHAHRNYFSRLIENSATTPGDLGEQTRAKLQRMRHEESD